MLATPPFFKNKKEFLAVAAVLIVIIVTRLFFIYQDYKSFRTLSNYYYTDAQVEKLYDGKG